MDKTAGRIRRGLRTRMHIRRLGVYRLSVHRTPRHIYAQVLDANGSKVIASASSLDKTIRGDKSYGGNIAAATLVGKLVAERAIAAGITSVAFDRSGFKYHGRVKALADAARDGGLQF